MLTHYHDFEIELSRCSHCRKPEIRVLDSSTNRPRMPFALEPEKQEALASKVAELECALFDTSDLAARRRLSEEIGQELFEILFPEPIGRTFIRSHDDAIHGNHGLRIRLSFGTPYDHDLGGLPWELLYDTNGRFITNDERTPVARYLDLDDLITPLAVEPPLRVLCVIACPDADRSVRLDYTDIDEGHHRDLLQKAIGSTTFLQPRFLHDHGPVTPASLRKYLKAAEAAGRPFHAVHFLGHGSFDGTGEGALFFEADNGTERLVTGRELAENLTPSIRLVVLASCSTGEIPPMRDGSRHAFSGVASALVHERVPAVVAMQFAVSEGAAADFAAGFYESIDQKRAIDEAVTEGRIRIRNEGEEGTLEWATPVLFLRARDGKVLDLKTDEIPPKTVSIFNVLDHGKEKMDHVDLQVDLREHFEGRFLRDGVAWNETIVGAVRDTLQRKLPAGSPCHLELAAPISVAFTAGFFLPINKREPVTLRQRDETWRFDGEPPADARMWLPPESADARVNDEDLAFPFVKGSDDIALIVDGAHSILDDVADYLRRDDLDAPSIGHVVYAGFEEAGHYRIRDGAHAQRLAEHVVTRVKTLARRLAHPTIHLFSPGPNALAFVIGRLSHVLPRVQLYEFAKEGKGHGSYQKSITLVPPEMSDR